MKFSNKLMKYANNYNGKQLMIKSKKIKQKNLNTNLIRQRLFNCMRVSKQGLTERLNSKCIKFQKHKIFSTKFNHYNNNNNNNSNSNLKTLLKKIC